MLSSDFPLIGFQAAVVAALSDSLVAQRRPGCGKLGARGDNGNSIRSTAIKYENEKWLIAGVSVTASRARPFVSSANALFLVAVDRVIEKEIIELCQQTTANAHVSRQFNYIFVCCVWLVGFRRSPLRHSALPSSASGLFTFGSFCH